MDYSYFLGIDIGSTTAKLVLARSNEDGTADVENVIYETYERHFSRVREKILDLLDALPLGDFTVDQISIPSVSVGEICATLTMLEIYGLVRSLPGGRYRRLR